MGQSLWKTFGEFLIETPLFKEAAQGSVCSVPHRSTRVVKLRRHAQAQAALGWSLRRLRDIQGADAAGAWGGAPASWTSLCNLL